MHADHNAPRQHVGGPLHAAPCTARAINEKAPYSRAPCLVPSIFMRSLAHVALSLSCVNARNSRPKQEGDGKNASQQALQAWHSTLPTFRSRKEISGLWALYLDHIFGLDTLVMPLKMSSFHFFYVDALPAELQGRVPLLGRSSDFNRGSFSSGETLLRVGQRAFGITGRSPDDVYHLYDPIAFAPDAISTVWVYSHRGGANESLGFPSFSRIEVVHCAENGNQTDFWLYPATGSGVYFDLGKTFVARNRCSLWVQTNIAAEHLRARGPIRCVPIRQGWHCPDDQGNTNQSKFYVGCRFSHLRRFCPGFWCASAQEMMAKSHSYTEAALKVLASRGFDSVQLTHTEEHGIYKFEIVDLRQRYRKQQAVTDRHPIKRTKFAPTPQPPRVCPHNMDSYYGGWGGNRPCRCRVTPARSCMHCR